MANTIQLKNSFKELFDSRFMIRANEIATASNVKLAFDVTDFLTIDPKDMLRNTNSFGVLFEESSDYVLDAALGGSALNNMVFNIAVVFPFVDNNTADNVQAIREALAMVLIRDYENSDVFNLSNVVIESTSAEPFQTANKSVKYVSTGIRFAINRGI